VRHDKARQKGADRGAVVCAGAEASVGPLAVRYTLADAARSGVSLSDPGQTKKAVVEVDVCEQVSEASAAPVCFRKLLQKGRSLCGCDSVETGAALGLVNG